MNLRDHHSIICVFFISFFIYFIHLPCIATTSPFTTDTSARRNSENQGVRQAEQIIAIKPKVSAQGVKVSILTDGKASDYNVFPLSNPARLVLDIFHIQAYRKRGKMNLKSQLVKGIRWSYTEGHYIRMVFDLIPDAGLSYRVISEDNQIVVYLGHMPDIPPQAASERIHSPDSRGREPSPRVNQREPLAEISPGNFILYIASYLDKHQAEKKVYELRKYGFNSFLHEKKISRETRFRVYVGAFDNKYEARKVGAELKQKGLIEYHMPRRVEHKMEVVPQLISIKDLDIIPDKKNMNSE
ncbi:MAG: SPOR domain-containing protein [bacterium]